MKLKTTKILKFSLICTFLYVNQVAQAITVDLGSIPFNHNSTTVNASIDRIGWLAATTIDGNLGGKYIQNGWSPPSNLPSPQTIAWTWQNSPTLTLSGEQSLEYYTYSISLHFGWTDTHSLREYSLSAGVPNDVNIITNYESVSNLGTNTISVDDNGTITTTQPPLNSGILDVHTLNFRSNTIINAISIEIATIPGWGAGENHGTNFLLTEITGSVTAEVVPEPSTYALLTGLIAFTSIAYRRKRGLKLKTSYLESDYT